MPRCSVDPITGAVTFSPTDKEKKDLEDRELIQSLLKRVKDLEERVKMLEGGGE